MCQGSFEKTFLRVTIIALSYVYCHVDSELIPVITPPPHTHFICPLRSLKASLPATNLLSGLSGKLKIKCPPFSKIPSSFNHCPLNACSVQAVLVSAPREMPRQS